MTNKAEARAIIVGWIDKAITDLSKATDGRPDERDLHELLMLRHQDEIMANKAIQDLLIDIGVDVMLEPHLAAGLHVEAAAEAVFKDAERGVRDGRVHKAH